MGDTGVEARSLSVHNASATDCVCLETYPSTSSRHYLKPDEHKRSREMTPLLSAPSATVTCGGASAWAGRLSGRWPESGTSTRAACCFAPAPGLELPPVGRGLRFRAVTVAALTAVALAAFGVGSASGALRLHDCAAPSGSDGFYKAIRATKNLRCATVNTVLGVWQGVPSERQSFRAAGRRWTIETHKNRGNRAYTTLHSPGIRYIYIVSLPYG